MDNILNFEFLRIHRDISNEEAYGYVFMGTVLFLCCGALPSIFILIFGKIKNKVFNFFLFVICAFCGIYLFWILGDLMHPLAWGLGVPMLILFSHAALFYPESDHFDKLIKLRTKFLALFKQR